MMQLIQTLAEQTGEVWEKLNDHPNRVYFPNFGSGDNVLKTGIDIDRVAFKVPGTKFEIYWYGLTIAVGIILAMIYGFRKMKKVGIDPDRATDAVIGGFFGAIIGARLYYIVFSDSTPLSKFFDFREGGLAIYGGLIGAIVVGGIIVRLRKLRLTAMLDVVAPCFFIGQCLGRWGNFFNQEAFGTNTTLPWGMLSKTTANYVSTHITDGSVDPTLPIHPCFLYESLWCLAGFLLLHFYFKHRKFDGEVFLCYTAWYGLGRFFIEGLRTDSLYIGGMRVSQLLAAVCVVVSLVILIVVRVRIAKFKDYVFFKDTQLSKAQIAYYENLKNFDKQKKELAAKISEAEDKGENTEAMKAELEEKYGADARHKLREALDEAEKADKKALEEKLAARAKLIAEENGEAVKDDAQSGDEQSEDNAEAVSQKSEKAQENTETQLDDKAKAPAEAAEDDVVHVIKDEITDKPTDNAQAPEEAPSEPATEVQEETEPKPKKKKKKKKPVQPQKQETEQKAADREQESEKEPADVSKDEKQPEPQEQEQSADKEPEPQQEEAPETEENAETETPQVKDPEDIRAEDIVAEVTQKMKEEKAEKDKEIQEIIAQASEKSDEIPSDSNIKVEDIISEVNEKKESTENSAPSAKSGTPNNQNAKRKNNRSRNRNKKKR